MTTDYDTPHHVKYPYQERISKLCDEYREKVKKFSSDNNINNLLVDLRNELRHVIDEIYQQLSIQVTHDIVIEPTKRKLLYNPSIPDEQACQICGEKRAVDRCHIIPREHGGDIDAGNMIYLCPMHHHLFDHCELSNDEFNKIVLKDKAEDSVEYFKTVYRPYHQMMTLLGHVPNNGCSCGFHNLGLDVVVQDNYACTCFICKGCKKKYAIPLNGLVKMLIAATNGKEKSTKEAIEDIRKNLIDKFGERINSDIMF